MTRRQRGGPRGAALVEMVLVAPVLVAMFFMAVWLTELVRAKLHVQQLCRMLLWERAGEGLSTPLLTVDTAEARALERAPTTVGKVAWRARLETVEVARSYPTPLPVRGFGDGGGEASRLFLAPGTRAILRRLGREAAALSASVELDLKNPYPVPWPGPVDAMVRGRLWARESLVASDGHLEEGGAVEAVGQVQNAVGSEEAERAFVARVKPLTFLGSSGAARALTERIASLPLVSARLPQLAGTHVVSRPYRDAPGDVAGCEGTPGYANAARGEEGVRDFMKPDDSWLDWPLPQCFGTAPFRDVHRYSRGEEGSGNLSMQILRRRGPYFLGCQRPMALDSSSSRPGPDGCEEP